MSTDNHTKQLFRGAFLLSFAGLFSKVLSAGYRIPLQNLTGDLGFYIYQQIYPIVGIALMLSLYGFPAAVSRLQAESSRSNILSIRSFYGPVLLVLYIGNGLLFFLLFTLADQLAGLMGDERLTSSLQVASFIFLLIPLTSLLRGTLQGDGQMAPTAVSQMLEQLIRVLVILTVAVYVAYEAEQYYLTGKAAAVGAIAGTTVSAVYLAWRSRKHFRWGRKKTLFSFRKYSESVFVFGVFLCCTQLMLLFIQLADTFTLVPGLIDFGHGSGEAKQWKGVLDRGQPLIQFGTVIGSSLALVLIPSVTGSRQTEKPQVFHQQMQSAWKVSFVLSSGATVGLITIFPYANRLLFQDAAGTASLRILMIAILVTSLAITSASFLQGLGFIYKPAFYVIAGLAVKLLLNMVLVPSFGLAGGAWATVLSLSVVLVLNLFALKKSVPDLSLRLIPGKAWLGATSAMLIWLVFMQFGLLNVWELAERLDYLFYVIAVTATGACLYLFVFINMNGFTDEELISLPGGQLIKQVWNRRK